MINPVEKVNKNFLQQEIVITDQARYFENKWRHWHYKNTTLLLLSAALFFYLAKTPVADNLIQQAGTLGYIGAFFAGLFFVSTFTAAPAAVVLFHLAERLHPVEIALLAGAGGVVGDYVIFRFMKDKIFAELRYLFLKRGKPVRALFKSPYFGWLTPIFGAILVASPVPDEVGVSMMGLSKMSTRQFLLIAFLLDVVGIFLIVSAARLI